MTSTLTPMSGPAYDESRALAAREWALIAAPVLAGLLCLVAAATDPAAGIDGEELSRLYAAHPDGLAVHALTLHFGYGLWILPALLVPRLVRGRGAWLANAGAVLGFLGITTLPGLMFTDFISAAMTQEFGAGTSAAVDERMSAMWGVPVFIAQGLPAAIVAPLVAGAALWRAGVVRWWAPLLLLVGFAGFFGSGALWWGGVIMTVALGGVSFALYSATRGTRRLT